jgi:hypothetical protein
MRLTPNVLRLAPVGVVVGLWTASLSALGCHLPPRCPPAPVRVFYRYSRRGNASSLVSVPPW